MPTFCAAEPGSTFGEMRQLAQGSASIRSVCVLGLHNTAKNSEGTILDLESGTPWVRQPIVCLKRLGLAEDDTASIHMTVIGPANLKEKGDASAAH